MWLKHLMHVDADLPQVYAQVEKFKTITGQGKRKGPTDQLFETFDATDLNKELKSIMDGLSVKVRYGAQLPKPVDDEG
jgi:hypothetical protein